MKISVIMPVYNAEKYLEEAVHSALMQPETEEVILVEDGSKDNSLAVCRHLSETCPKICLLTHGNGRNLGSSETRNLGIKNATNDYVAFLDADDFYLPNRFRITKRVFAEKSDADGVYEAIGTFFESPYDRKIWEKLGYPIITTVRKGVSPKDFFDSQAPIGRGGHCHLNGLTVKKTVFDKTGFFDKNLVINQDTAFFIKLAACATMFSGSIDEPVAIRRVYGTNSIIRETTSKYKSLNYLMMWVSLYQWAKAHANDKQQKVILDKLSYAWRLDRIEGGKWRRLIWLLLKYRWLIFDRRCLRVAVSYLF